MQFDPLHPIWLQVMEDIQNAIVTGSRQPGEKLPGTRDLAVAYGINPNTAIRVYQELEKAGLCQTKRGMGTYVTEDAQRIDALRQAMARQAVKQFLQKMNALGISRQDAIQIIKEEKET